VSSATLWAKRLRVSQCSPLPSAAMLHAYICVYYYHPDARYARIGVVGLGLVNSTGFFARDNGRKSLYWL